MAERLRLTLKKGEDSRILKGEFWVYDNEIQTPLEKLPQGELADLFTADGRYVASGYVNPRSVIAFRVLTWKQGEEIDQRFLAERIIVADRQRLAARPDNTYYRMVYGEADLLPGLVVDRFATHLIVQITTAGMERFKDDIFTILQDAYPDAVLIEKSLNTSREKEQLAIVNRVVTPGGTAQMQIQINGLRFQIDFLKSQKTGFFLDQRDNYRLLEPLSRGRHVLDAFSYAGAWGLHAKQYGASHVDFLEISGEYLEQSRENVRLNGLPLDEFTFIQDDAIKRLKEMSLAGEERSLIILDPPAFVKSRSKVREAMRGYKEINLRALKMISPGGFLVTCSCSHFLSRDDFIRTIADAAADAGRRIKLIEYRSQPYDHAVLIPLFQSDYLKCALFTVY